MPLGTSAAEAKALLDFNDTLARKVAEAAHKEQKKHMESVKVRREAMRAAFADSKTQRVQALEASATRHSADLARFETVKAKQRALDQDVDDKRAAKAQADQLAHRQDARRGAGELEATLRRLGIDSDEASQRPKASRAINTTLAGATGTVHRAPRDTHATEITEADLQRLRQRQNQDFVERIRTRRIEDVEGRREKDKRQWRMEGELAKTATEMVSRTERLAWIEKAREIAPVERRLAFETLKSTVAAAANAKYVAATHAGMNALAAQQAADVDAKFAVVAAAQRTDHRQRFAREMAEAAQAQALVNADRVTEATTFCAAISSAVVDLALEVISVNTARIQTGAVTAVSEPLGVSEWRDLVDTAFTKATTAATSQRPQSCNTVRQVGLRGQPQGGSASTHAFSPIAKASRSAVPTPFPPDVGSPQSRQANSRPRSATEPTKRSENDGSDLTVMRARVEEVAAGLLDSLAERDAKWLEDVVRSAAKDLATEATDAEFEAEVDRFTSAAAPVSAVFLVGAVAGAVLPDIETIARQHQLEHGHRESYTVVSKAALAAQCAAAAAAAAAAEEEAAEQAASMAKSKGGGGGKGGANPAASTKAPTKPSELSTDALGDGPASNTAPAAPLPTPISLLANRLTASGPITPSVAADVSVPRVIVVGFTEAEAIEAIDASGIATGQVAVAQVVQDTRGAIARLRVGIPDRKLDPAAIHRAMLEERARDTEHAGVQLAAALSVGMPTSVARGVAVVPIHGPLTAAAVCEVVSRADSIELRHVTRSGELDKASETLAGDLAKMHMETTRPHLKLLRSHDIETATALRTAAAGVVSVLADCVLPQVPPSTATATEQHDYWVQSDHVRSRGMSSVSEIVGECRATFAEVAAARLHTSCGLLTALAEAILGAAANDGALPSVVAPSLETCKQHMTEALGEFVLLPSTTEGTDEREYRAFCRMLEEASQSALRSLRPDVARPSDQLTHLMWKAVSGAVIAFTAETLRATTWWYHALVTASAIWLQARLAAANSRVPADASELLDVASVCDVEAGTEPVTTPGRRSDPAATIQRLLSLVPVARSAAVDSRCVLSAFAARHLRHHGQLAEGDLSRALLSAQVASLSAFTNGCDPDDLFLPCRALWYSDCAAVSTKKRPTPPPLAALADTDAPLTSAPLSVAGDQPASGGTRPNSRVSGKPNAPPAAAAPKRGVTPSQPQAKTPTPPAATTAAPPLVSVAQPASAAPSRPLSRAAPDEPVPEVIIPACRFGLFVDVDSLPPRMTFDDAAIAMGLGGWSNFVLGGAPATPRLLPPVNSAMVRACAASLGEALVADARRSVEACCEALASANVTFTTFAALPVWHTLDAADVRSVWALLAEPQSAGIPLRRLLRVLLADTKSEMRAIDNCFLFLHAFKLGKHATLSLAKQDADHSKLPARLVAALFPGLSFEAITAADAFTTAARAPAPDANTADVQSRMFSSVWGRSVVKELPPSSKPYLMDIAPLQFPLGSVCD